MNRRALAFAVLLLVIAPSVVFAKGVTTKIVIQGSSLKAPIEIVDAPVVQKFRVWSGPETSGNEAQSFVVDWAHGPVMEPPKTLPRYRVSFWAMLDTEKLAYVVTYAFDPSSGQGYVYLPGPNDDSYSVNTGSLDHGVEGQWFRAWSAWDQVAQPRIQSVLRQ